LDNPIGSFSRCIDQKPILAVFLICRRMPPTFPPMTAAPFHIASATVRPNPPEWTSARRRPRLLCTINEKARASLPCRQRHGTSDPIVRPSNSEDIIRQWTNVHGLSDRPSYQRLIDGDSLRVWTDGNGEALIEAFAVSNMAHGVPAGDDGPTKLLQCRRIFPGCG
jgi:hypothetical protein